MQQSTLSHASAAQMAPSMPPTSFGGGVPKQMSEVGPMGQSAGGGGVAMHNMNSAGHGSYPSQQGNGGEMSYASAGGFPTRSSAVQQPTSIAGRSEDAGGMPPFTHVEATRHLVSDPAGGGVVQDPSLPQVILHPASGAGPSSQPASFPNHHSSAPNTVQQQPLQQPASFGGMAALSQPGSVAHGQGHWQGQQFSQPQSQQQQQQQQQQSFPAPQSQPGGGFAAQQPMSQPHAQVSFSMGAGGGAASQPASFAGPQTSFALSQQGMPRVPTGPMHASQSIAALHSADTQPGPSQTGSAVNQPSHFAGAGGAMHGAMAGGSAPPSTAGAAFMARSHLSNQHSAASQPLSPRSTVYGQQTPQPSAMHPPSHTQQLQSVMLGSSVGVPPSHFASYENGGGVSMSYDETVEGKPAPSGVGSAWPGIMSVTKPSQSHAHGGASQVSHPQQQQQQQQHSTVPSIPSVHKPFSNSQVPPSFSQRSDITPQASRGGAASQLISQAQPQQVSAPPASSPRAGASHTVVSTAAPSTPRHAHTPAQASAVVPYTPRQAQSPTSTQQLSKIVQVMSPDSGDVQSFRLCAGETGENVRAAIRGAFGMPHDQPFSIRDMAGCHVVLGYPSVSEGAQYQLYKKRAAGVSPTMHIGSGGQVQSRAPSPLAAQPSPHVSFVPPGLQQPLSHGHGALASQQPLSQGHGVSQMPQQQQQQQPPSIQAQLSRAASQRMSAASRLAADLAHDAAVGSPSQALASSRVASTQPPQAQSPQVASRLSAGGWAQPAAVPEGGGGVSPASHHAPPPGVAGTSIPGTPGRSGIGASALQMPQSAASSPRPLPSQQQLLSAAPTMGRSSPVAATGGVEPGSTSPPPSAFPPHNTLSGVGVVGGGGGGSVPPSRMPPMSAGSRGPLPSSHALPGAPTLQHSEAGGDLVTVKPVSAALQVPGPKHGHHGPMAPLQTATKSLLVNISYTGQKEALDGPHGDGMAVSNYLDNEGFGGERMMLSDGAGQADPNQLPTKQNILQGLRWVAGGARPGDAVFVHFSGHGVEVRHEDGGEQYREALLPLDFRATKPFQVVQTDEVFDAVRALPAGALMVVVCDCAHGGSMFDLPYTLRSRTDGQVEWRERLGAPQDESVGTILVVSSWKGDAQGNGAVNALTGAYLRAMARDCNPTFEAMVADMRRDMHGDIGAGQHIPQISSNRRFNFTERFYLTLDD